MSRRPSLINSINQIIADINYKITRKLGEGMFSIVKMATHSLTGEKVAIKVLEKTRISKIEDKERINREMAIMKKLHHYNIVKLYQIVENKLTIYLIQEHVQGKEFMEYLTKKGKLVESEACKFYHQIISGLDYLHRCGIAHRDFKPENILLTNDNTILKIIDFGLGNTYKKNQLLRTACGSPCYAPPEMIQEKSYDGTLSDIWSSGIILYLMLCGHLPFYHEKNEVMYKQILSGKFDLPKHLSDEAKDLLKKILEVDPKKRLNFEGIKAHPWFNIIDKNYLMHKGVNINEDVIPIDDEIIRKMELIGFNKMEVKFMLLKNYHNRITTVYELFLKQKVEKGQKSIADLNSDLFDQYINDKSNKISTYGSLESVLRDRIFEGNKSISILPNYFEDKYEDNIDNIIVGDNGSVIERLIKAGRFTYDEENMCLNRVTNTNKPIKKEIKKENEGESKFKTLTQMNGNIQPKKFVKIYASNTINEISEERETERNEEKKERVKFKDKDTEEKKHKVKFFNPKEFEEKKQKVKFKEKEMEEKKEEKKEKNKIKTIKFFKKVTKKKEEPENINVNEEIDGENNDWYKEVEAMVTGEKKKATKPKNNVKNEPVLKKSSSAVRKRKKDKDEEIKNGLNNEDPSFQRLILSTSQLKRTPKKQKKTEDKKADNMNSNKAHNVRGIIIKSSITKNLINEVKNKKLKNQHKHQHESAKNIKIKKSDKKIQDLNGYFFSDDNDSAHNHFYDTQSVRTSQYMSQYMNIKKKPVKPDKKKSNTKCSENNIGSKRIQSCTKRKK